MLILLQIHFSSFFMQQGDRINMDIRALYSEATVQAMDMGEICGLLAGINRNSRPKPVSSLVN
jgi:hypothetical protein